MADIYQVAAKVAKVSVGAEDGNQVARILRKDDIVPEGVPAKKLKRLVELKLIKKADLPAPASEENTEPDGEATAEAEAEEKAAPAKPAGRKPAGSK